MAPRFTGKVKAYNPEKNDLGIRRDDTGEDVRIDLESGGVVGLEVGQRVRFSLVHGRSGLYAQQIELI